MPTLACALLCMPGMSVISTVKVAMGCFQTPAMNPEQVSCIVLLGRMPPGRSRLKKSPLRRIIAHLDGDFLYLSEHIQQAINQFGGFGPRRLLIRIDRELVILFDDSLSQQMVYRLLGPRIIAPWQAELEQRSCAWRLIAAIQQRLIDNFKRFLLRNHLIRAEHSVRIAFNQSVAHSRLLHRSTMRSCSHL